MTLKEAIQQAKNVLNGISVPVPMLQQVGEPVSEAAQILAACIEAIERDEQRLTAEGGEQSAP